MTRATRRLLCTALSVLAFATALTVQDWSASARGSAFGEANQAAQPAKLAPISEADMKAWLTYLASDALQGRDAFTEGYGLAASFVAENLRTWGVKPLGDDGTYFQEVKRRSYRVTRNSSVTVDAGGQSRTFKHGDHVTFAANSGGKQTLAFNAVEFVGYGQVNLDAKYDDFRGRDVKGKLVVGLSGTPKALVPPQVNAAPGGGGRGGRGANFAGRGNYIVQTLGAGGVVSLQVAPPPPSAEELAAQEALDKANQAVVDAQTRLQQARAAAGRGGRGGGGGAGRGAAGRGAAMPAADFTGVQNVNALMTPQFTGDEAFFDFLFSTSPVKLADLRAKAAAGEPLTPFTLPNVKVTVSIDQTYDVLTTERTKNVVGLVEGSDPQLRSTYVFFGAHLDHVGYQQGAGGGRGGGGGAAPASPGAEPDLISNGADDDGSGSTALLGLAKAFATGPKPRRSVVFVWHTAEEDGLLGSRYMADFPVVPLDRIQAQFNMDMIGRNRDDDPSMGNTVFVIGADRISTELHNLVVETNASLAKPLTLDYEYNDPSDTNNFYTRSDHYSYAAKGIPIAFFFTGTHPDYHRVSDHADKILYPKLTRIAQLVYQSGFAVADSQKPLTRDNLGPRSGRGFTGRIK